MLSTELAKKYAMAMFELAEEEDKLVAWTEELLLVGEVVAQFPEIMMFVRNPQVATAIKKELLEEIFSKECKLDTSVMNFLYLLIDKHRMGIIEEIVKEFHSLSNEARNILLARVITAKALTKKQQNALIEKLQAITGKEIELQLKTRKAIIGGVIVQIGDKLIDGSVSGSLKALEKQLLAK